MKFDFIIGNPPYQNQYNGNSNGANPVYNIFLDGAREISEGGILVHPARFLFNVGKTPKQWNSKMLHDKHFKILKYYPKSDMLFRNVDIKGGVVISCWDRNKDFGEIGVFTVYDELRSIMKKVKQTCFSPFSEIVSPVGTYRLTDELYRENKWAIERPSKGHKYDLTSNVFSVFPELFFDCPPEKDGYIRVYGRANNTRCTKWIKKDYVKVPDNFASYKVIVPKANGSGMLGETLSTPVVCDPFVGFTFTFLSIGGFKTKEEAIAAQKYICTKFARIMLGVLKVTQDNLRDTWGYVPLQDFTPNSDIDWAGSVAEIDRQLYRKYNLSDDEIAFIETKVKEMI